MVHAAQSIHPEQSLNDGRIGASSAIVLKRKRASKGSGITGIVAMLAMTFALQAISALAQGDPNPASDLFPSIFLDEDEALARGYRQVELDLGSPELNFTVLARERVTTEALANQGELPSPGYRKLATLRDPAAPEAFDVTVTAFTPGFAATAYNLSAQVLFAEGYRLAGSDGSMFETSALRSQSVGLIFEGEIPVRAARSFCANRQGTFICLLMRFELEHEVEAMEETAILIGSLAFEDDRPDSFGLGQIAEERLALEDGTTLSFQRPSAWAMTANEFETGDAGKLVMHFGHENDPLASLSFSASQGGEPLADDGFRAVADDMVANHLTANADIFAKPRILNEHSTSSQINETTYHRYAYVADRLHDGGEAQFRVSLMVKDDMRYATVLTTNHGHPESDWGVFYPRWAAAMAEDLAVHSVVGHR